MSPFFQIAAIYFGYIAIFEERGWFVVRDHASLNLLIAAAVLYALHYAGDIRDELKGVKEALAAKGDVA